MTIALFLYDKDTTSAAGYPFYYSSVGGTQPRWLPIAGLSKIDDDGRICISICTHAGDSSIDLSGYSLLCFHTDSSYNPYDSGYVWKSEHFVHESGYIPAYSDGARIVSNPDLSRTALLFGNSLTFIDGSGNTVNTQHLSTHQTSVYYVQYGSLNIGRNNNTVSLTTREYGEDGYINMYHYDATSGTCLNMASYPEYFEESSGNWVVLTKNSALNEDGSVLIGCETLWDDGYDPSIMPAAVLQSASGTTIQTFVPEHLPTMYEWYDAIVDCSKTSTQMYTVNLVSEDIPYMSLHVLNSDLEEVFLFSGYTVETYDEELVTYTANVADTGKGIYFTCFGYGEFAGTPDYYFLCTETSSTEQVWRSATTEEVSGSVIRIMSIGK